MEDDAISQKPDDLEISIQRIFDKSVVQIYKELEPLRIRNITVMLDTFNAETIPFKTYKLKWDFTYDGLVKRGVVTTSKKVYNFIGMRVFALKLNQYPPRTYPYYFPAIEKAVNNLYNIWTIFVEEFASQSYIAQEGRKFHFLGEASRGTVSDPSLASAYNLTNVSFERYNNGFFWFYKPIQELKSLTLSLGTPLYETPWPDPFQIGFFEGITPAIGFNVTLGFGPMLNTQVGDRVLLSGQVIPGYETYFAGAYNSFGLVVIAITPAPFPWISTFYFDYPWQNVGSGFVQVQMVNYKFSTLIPMEFYFIDDDTSVEPDELYKDEVQDKEFEIKTVSKIMSNGLATKSGPLNDTYKLYKEIYPNALFRKQYVYFDSWYSDYISGNRISWKYDAVQQTNTSVNTDILLKDIVAIKIFKFSFNNFNPAIVNSNIQTMYIGIEELNRQSFIYEETKTHFLLQVKPANFVWNGFINVNSIECDQKWNNWGEFNFNEPAILRDRMTLNFYYQPLNQAIQPYIFEMEIPAQISLASYGIGKVELYINNPYILPFLGPTFIVREVSIYIKNWTTTAPLADAGFIEYINRKSGHSNIEVVYLNAPLPLNNSQINFYMYNFVTSELYWPYTTVPVVGASISDNVKIKFTYNRVSIAMEFTYLKSTPGYQMDDVADVYSK